MSDLLGSDIWDKDTSSRRSGVTRRLREFLQQLRGGASGADPAGQHVGGARLGSALERPRPAPPRPLPVAWIPPRSAGSLSPKGANKGL